MNISTLADELAEASTIQKRLCSKLPKISGLDLDVSLLSAESLGGDCYDFLPIDEYKTMFYVGDVTGHGLPAGMIMTMANSLFYTLSQFYSSPREILTQSNLLLRKKLDSKTFMTAVMCHWDSKLSEFSYTSAGHEQIIHYSHRKKEFQLCPSGGVALGMLADISGKLVEQNVELELGDIAYLYSDGIKEALSPNDSMLGLNGFIKILERKVQMGSVKAMKKEILHDVFDFMGNKPQRDDMTLMVIRREG